MTLTTGSGGERFMACRASSVLPRVFDETPSDAASRGTVVHAYLERVASGIEPEEAVLMIGPDDAKHRDACRAIDLSSIADLLALDHEVTLAYSPSTDTARVLGQSLGRAYDAAGVTADEIPGTPDVIGVDLKNRRGLIIDYKSGWAKLPPAAQNWQLRGGAIALARAFDLDEIEVQIVFLRDGQSVRRDRAVFHAADLAEIAGQMAIAWARALADRAAYRDHGIFPDATKGAHCRYCPSAHACPAFTSIVRASLDEAIVPGQIGTLTEEELAHAWRRISVAEAGIKMLKEAVRANAVRRPILLETTAEGEHVWLGLTQVEGNDVVDPDIANDVLGAELAPDDPVEQRAIADEIASRKVAKTRIAKAVKARVAKGRGASTIDRVLKEIAARGGITAPIRETVAVFTTPAIRLTGTP